MKKLKHRPKRPVAYSEYGMRATYPKIAKAGMVSEKAIKKMRHKRGLK